MMQIEVLRHCLFQGVGRPYLYFKAHDLTPYRELLLDFCLYENSYDRQSETNRAGYLYEIIKGSQEEGWFTERILEAVARPDQKMYLSQLFDFAVILAREGNTRARELIYERVRGDEEFDDGFRGIDWQLVELDGLEGFIFVAELLARSSDDRRFDHGWYLLDYVAERCASETLASRLAAARAASPLLDRYLDGLEEWRKNFEHSREEKRLSWQALMNQSFAELLENRPGLSLPGLRQWGKMAPESEIARAATCFLACLESDCASLIFYLNIFQQRAFPFDPRSLFPLLASSDESVVRLSLLLLGQLDHPEIRELGLNLLAANRYPCDALDFFVRHYREEDLPFLTAYLRQLTDDAAIHSAGFGFLNIFKAHATSEALPILLDLYQRSPCSCCRAGFVERMLAIGPLPAWLAEECRHDVNQEIREMVG